MNKLPWAGFIAVILAVVFGVSIVAQSNEAHSVDHSSTFFALVDKTGRVVTYTALGLQVGDAYIDGANNLYEVVALRGNRAEVTRRGRVELPMIDVPATPEQALAAWSGMPGRRGRVAIYHTHNDESYVPTSGIANRQGRGDIHEVGRVLAEALEREGFPVDWSQRLHLPHDGQAYFRSRRTLLQLLRRKPQTALDIHRDAVPRPEEYRTTVAGMEMTSVRLVVGRQNPQRNVNLEYAKRIKAIADKWYPGLVKGIFLASSDYNQDLGPKVILMEFGTHTTSLEEAVRSARLMAQVIPVAAGLTPQTASSAQRSASRVGARVAIWILVVGVVGFGAYIIINREGWMRLWSGFNRILGNGAGPGRGDDHQGS